MADIKVSYQVKDGGQTINEYIANMANEFLAVNHAWGMLAGYGLWDHVFEIIIEYEVVKIRPRRIILPRFRVIFNSGNPAETNQDRTEYCIRYNQERNRLYVTSDFSGSADEFVYIDVAGRRTDIVGRALARCIAEMYMIMVKKNSAKIDRQLAAADIFKKLM